MPTIVYDHTDLQWCQAILAAINSLQLHLHPGARHSDSISNILNEALQLTGCSCGMLANVVTDEPCRLTDVIPNSETREVNLRRFDRLARKAMLAGSVLVEGKGTNACAAIPLSLGRETFGVLVVGNPPLDWNWNRLDDLRPFIGTAAAVIRQFQDDLSGSQVGAVLDTLAEGILTIDSNANVEGINAAAEQVFGYTADEVLSQPVSMLVSNPAVLQRFESGDIAEIEGRRKNGTAFPLEISLSTIEVQGKQLSIVITRDLTEFKARQQIVEMERANTQTLELLVRIDALTGIANRRHFDETLETEVRRAAREHKAIALLLCDIDFFKAFNDRYGHVAGDKALRSVARAIDECFQRAGDLAARYGGEEFGVVISAADIKRVGQLAQNVVDRVAALSIPHGASPIADQLTLSIGAVSTVPGPHFDPAQLLKDADRALYQAKGEGRNKVVLADRQTEQPLRLLGASATG